MAFALHQLSVSSLLNQPAILQDQDQAEILHRGEVVSDDDCGLATEQTFECVVKKRPAYQSAVPEPIMSKQASSNVGDGVRLLLLSKIFRHWRAI